MCAQQCVVTGFGELPVFLERRQSGDNLAQLLVRDHQIALDRAHREQALLYQLVEKRGALFRRIEQRGVEIAAEQRAQALLLVALRLAEFLQGNFLPVDLGQILRRARTALVGVNAPERERKHHQPQQHLHQNLVLMN